MQAEALREAHRTRELAEQAEQRQEELLQAEQTEHAKKEEEAEQLRLDVPQDGQDDGGEAESIPSGSGDESRDEKRRRKE